MAGAVWELDSTDGQLTVTTAVAGAASRVGHRLTIAMSWRGTVEWADEPVAVELTADVDSFKVLRGEGGATPLTGPEKALVRLNALKSLDAVRFPRIRFRSDEVEPTADGYRLVGTLQIHGVTRDHTVDLTVEQLGERVRVSAQDSLRQSDFGIKPFSMMMGALKVADEVRVSFAAELEPRD
ncbi:YceI family protein [Mycobacterium sp. ITM-2016-00317]|uniref:YceI family protein n=1 Tax=Mycobacterium sp. ITM-2016-00317 TaxID=2099694 RepID=UPI000D4ED6FA|nr:YceI family protein [Mycobacterium sp. ITM-2016-00317]WNG88565.1 YceI family protein [Mycobacterium sp. ITM-2016-00317]